MLNPRLGLAHHLVVGIERELMAIAELLELHADRDPPRENGYRTYAKAARLAASVLQGYRCGYSVTVRVLDPEIVRPRWND